jgi:hypothetical protein
MKIHGYRRPEGTEAIVDLGNSIMYRKTGMMECWLFNR